MKILFLQNVIEFCLYGSSWQQVSINLKVMVWHQTGDKPLLEPVLTQLHESI